MKILQLPVETISENPLDVLRKRFFKGFTYNMNDPRSPSLNRTPLVFEDSSERTLNLDDTFADLFVGSSTLKQTNNLEMNDAVKPPSISEEVSVSADKIEMSPISQQKIDPRSPSIAIDRTPIIFNDDENESNEDAMLENILSCLNLNVSDASLKTVDIPINEDGEQNVAGKPTNRHLDRIRNGKRTISKGPQRRQKRALRQKIYEDRENQPTTPQLKSRNNINLDTPKGKRTPLTCVRNSSTHVRSRSVESSARSAMVKTRLPLMSFDDTLNPNENIKVSNMHILRDNTQDSMLF